MMCVPINHVAMQHRNDAGVPRPKYTLVTYMSKNMGGKHEMSHKDREISNEVVSRSRFISNGRLPINQVRRIVECSGYRSIWGNNNTNLTLVPIDRTRELSLKDNCMLVRVAPSRPVCATCGTQGVRACQTHFAHTGNAI